MNLDELRQKDTMAEIEKDSKTEKTIIQKDNEKDSEGFQANSDIFKIF